MRGFQVHRPWPTDTNISVDGYSVEVCTVGMTMPTVPAILEYTGILVDPFVM